MAQEELNAASAAFMQKKFEEAYALWTKNIDNVDDKSRVLVHVNRGKALTNLTRYVEGLECFREALALSPGDEQAFRARTSAYLKSEDFHAAFSSAQEACTLHPDNGSLLADQAFCCMKLNKAQEAVIMYESARDLGDNTPETTKNYGQALSRRALELQNEGEFSAAEALYDASIKIEPTESRHFNRSQICSQAASKAGEKSSKDKFTKKALDDLRAVIRFNKSNADAHEQLGTLLMKVEEYDSAKVSLKSFLSLSPKSSSAWYNLGLALMRTNAPPQESVDCFEKCLQITPGLECALKALEVQKGKLMLAQSSTSTKVVKSAPLAPAPPPTITALASSMPQASTPSTSSGPASNSKASVDPATYFTSGKVETQEGFLGEILPQELLKTGLLPAVVDKAHKEAYLSSAEFQESFGCDKVAFYAQPKWKRDNSKKKLGLF